MFSVINDDSRGGLDATHLSPHKPLSPSSSSHRDFSPLIVGGRAARSEREKVFEIRKHLSSSFFFFFFSFFFLSFFFSFFFSVQNEGSWGLRVRLG